MLAGSIVERRQDAAPMRARTCTVSRLEGTVDARLCAANGNIPGEAMAALQFGIFDQNDHGRYPLTEQYDKRLALIEAYDRAGFRT